MGNERMTADEVREWLLNGGKIFRESRGPDARYRIAGADVAPEPPPPEVPAEVFEDYERNGWLEELADGTMYLINAEGRAAVG